MRCSRFRRPAAFTLLEVLCALLVASMLVGVTLPVLVSAREFARKIETRARFSQWILAFEHYRDDRGQYPPVAVSGLLDAARFRAALTGRDPSGQPLSGGDLLGNIRRTLYLTFVPGEWQAPTSAHPEELYDGFGNSRIGVLLDLDGDGAIRGAELQLRALDSGNAREGFAPGPPLPASLTPADRIPAPVAFYSAGRGKESSDYVCSWR